MGQLLRIHVKNNDHTFRILNVEPLSRETKVIELSLDGRSLKIIRTEKGWVADLPVEGITPELITAVATTITLRFRI